MGCSTLGGSVSFLITGPVILAFLFAQRFFWPHGGR